MRYMTQPGAPPAAWQGPQFKEHQAKTNSTIRLEHRNSDTPRVPDDQPYFLGPNIAMIRVDPKQALSQYIEHYLRSPTGLSATLGFAKAVAQPSLSMGTIRTIPVALPPLAEQHRIVAEVDRRLSIVREVEAEVDANLKRAKALRQSVLAKAFGTSAARTATAAT